MKVVLVQLNSVPGDFEATVNRMLGVDARAARAGADLLVFPPTLLSGAYQTPIASSVAFELDMLEAVERYAARAQVRSVVPSYVNVGMSGYTEVFLCEDGVAGPLRLAESQRVGSEADAPELAPAAFEVGEVSVRVALDGVTANAPEGADLTIVCPYLPFCDEDSSTLLVGAGSGGAFREMVGSQGGWLAVLQGVGAYDDAVLAGGSFAIDPDDRVVAACPLFEEGLASFDLVLGGDEDTLAPGVPAQAGDPQADPDRALGPLGQASPLVGKTLGEIGELTAGQRTAALWDALVVATRDYVRKTGFSDVIVGLSGGIDSAVVAAIAADALGPSHVHGVLMPGPFSSAGSVVDAQDLAQALGIESRLVPISEVYEAAKAGIGQAAGVAVEGLTSENLQARLRGLVLMTVSNALGALVLNTGNKSEAGMGYSTLYGDTVGAYAPISDVYKGRVYDLARSRNARAGRPVIPESILTKAPSAELSAGQTDEGSFGARYREIDRILYLHIERGLDAADIVARGFDRDTVVRILRACKNAEFKRRQEPLGPVVSLVAMGDRAWPVVLGWQDKARDLSVPWGVATPFGNLVSSGAADGGGDEPDFDESAAVEAKLGEMLGRFSHQDQAIGTVGDVAFGMSISGRGPDMDDVMGIPVFSKN